MLVFNKARFLSIVFLFGLLPFGVIVQGLIAVVLWNQYVATGIEEISFFPALGVIAVLEYCKVLVLWYVVVRLPSKHRNETSHRR